MSYIIFVNDTEQGPYSLEDLSLIENVGELTDATRVRVDGHDVWKTWAAVKAERQRIQDRVAAFHESIAPVSRTVISAKSRGVYIILGLLLGTMGIHNFYAGYYLRGALQLLITATLAVIIVGPVIAAVWAIIEVITIRQDAQGTPFAI